MHFDAAAMLLHDTVADAEPQSHAFSDIFRSEKRIEDLVNVFGGSPFAVVAHHNQALAVFIDATDPVYSFSFRRRDAFPCVEGVLQQVNQNLSDLVRVGRVCPTEPAALRFLSAARAWIPRLDLDAPARAADDRHQPSFSSERLARGRKMASSRSHSRPPTKP